MRGKVAFKPLLFKSLGVFTVQTTKGVEISYHSGLAPFARHLPSPFMLKFLSPSLRFALVCLLTSVSLSGCGVLYQQNVSQGNYLSKEQVDQLKVGMTREQVKFLLGTPLLVDPFRPERWEYVFSYTDRSAGKFEVRGVTVLFVSDRLSKVDATALPEKDDGKDPALPRINRETLTK
jgi:outer membrane protein assembly factor BamE